MSEHDHILPNEENRKAHLSEEQLIAYLEGRLPAGEQHEVEQWLTSGGMESDALEGLQELSPDETKQTLNRLNYQLHKNLHPQKNKRRYISDNRWTLLTIILILALTIAAFIIITMAVKK